MKKEYDFSKAERGKFYRPDSVLVPPIHAEPDTPASIESRGTSTSIHANALPKKDEKEN